MTSEIEQRREARDAERKEVLSPGSIIGGLIAFGIILLAAPPLLLFLPFALVGLVILYKVGAKSTRKGEALARAKPGAGEISDEVSIGVGNASSLVLNDWGMLWTTPGSGSIELAWSEVASVEEPLTAMLAFHSRAGHVFSADLSTAPYLQVARKVFEKVPQLAHLDLDPLTGESRLWERLGKSPREWSGRWGTFGVTPLAVRRDFVDIRWDDMQSVVEGVTETDEGPSTWGLAFTGRRVSIDVASHELDDGRPAGFTPYDWLRAVALERLADRTSLDRRRMIPTPRERARRELELFQETLAAATPMAFKTGKLEYLAPRFRHMLALIDTFSLGDDQGIRNFYLDYAELLRRTGRQGEAEGLERRCG